MMMSGWLKCVAFRLRSIGCSNSRKSHIICFRERPHGVSDLDHLNSNQEKVNSQVNSLKLKTNWFKNTARSYSVGLTLFWRVGTGKWNAWDFITFLYLRGSPQELQNKFCSCTGQVVRRIRLIAFCYYFR